MAAILVTASLLLFAGFSSIAQAQQITMQRAQEIAMQHVPDTVLDSIELERERGTLVYEVELKDTARNIEYEVIIHADTGEILRTEQEVDD